MRDELYRIRLGVAALLRHAAQWIAPPQRVEIKLTPEQLANLKAEFRKRYTANYTQVIQSLPVDHWKLAVHK